jgi:hypothetical protein
METRKVTMPVVSRFVFWARREAMMKQTPIAVEVVTYIPTTFIQCWGCETAFGLGALTNKLHNEQLNAFPAEWKQEAAVLAEWTQRLRQRFGRRVRVRLVDAMSLRGVWLSLRHNLHRYPAFIIGGRARLVGLDVEQVDTLIAAALASA